jgi:tetratricopeptide (TPR) repeat protein
VTVPDPAGSRAILIGVHSAADGLGMGALPAVEQNLAAMRRLLTDGTVWDLPVEHCFSIPEPAYPHEVLDEVNLAGAYEEAGRLQEALTLYESNLEQRTRLLGPHHPDVLASMNNLAGAFKESGRQEEAVALYRVALPKCLETLGQSHPLTRTIRRNLSALTGSTRDDPSAPR